MTWIFAILQRRRVSQKIRRPRGQTCSPRRCDEKEGIGASVQVGVEDVFIANGQEGILREINQYPRLLEQTTLFQDRKVEEKYTGCFVCLRIVKIRQDVRRIGWQIRIGREQLIIAQN